MTVFAQVAADSYTSIQSVGFWALMIPTLIGLGASIKALVEAFAAKIQAAAAKDRSDLVAIELVRTRETSRLEAEAARMAAVEAKQTAETARQEAMRQGEKLDQIGVKTDGHLSMVMEANKLLQEQLSEVQKTLATLQGREIERKDAVTPTSVAPTSEPTGEQATILTTGPVFPAKP